jgi:hypothetical protein
LALSSSPASPYLLLDIYYQGTQVFYDNSVPSPMQSLIYMMEFAALLSAAAVGGIKLHSSLHGRGPEAVIPVQGWTRDRITRQYQAPVISSSWKNLRSLIGAEIISGQAEVLAAV